MLVYRHGMTGRFFRARRGPAVLFGVLFAAFALVLSITLPTWLSVGVGNPAGETVTALTKDKEFRDEAARFFIEKLTEDAPTEDLALFDELETTITEKLDELAENDEFMAKVDGISEPIERWSYAVVIGDRMYTVETRAPKGKVDDAAKAAAKAVAAALAPPMAATATVAATERMSRIRSTFSPFSISCATCSKLPKHRQNRVHKKREGNIQSKQRGGWIP